MRKYENPNVTSENRLPQRSWYIPGGKAEFQSLNGEWRFNFSENGDVVKEIEVWDTIKVPSCWQTEGYENPNYTNINYPFPCDPPYVPDINPVGIYERTFEIEYLQPSTYIVLEGVSSCAEIYINKQYIGFTQGSRLMSEFDITDYVRAGTNIIRVYVKKWCCGSYLEDQDAFRYNGIFRDIYLISRPDNHIFDIDIRTDDNTVLCKADKPCRIELYDNDELISSKEAPTGYCEFTVETPNMWNAENPYLYTVKFYASEEVIVRKFGFRSIAVSEDYQLLINDSPVKLKGVNHHDTDPVKGWAMSEEDILRDLKLIKSLNINTIRTSHYPPSPKFLDYCDELGLYVVLETDIETHGFLRRNANTSYAYDVEDKIWPCNSPLWEKEFVSRMQRAYERDKIHSSIIMWSTGNESGYGNNQDKMIEWLKQRDNVRLIHCEDASRLGHHYNTSVFSSMYPSISCIENWAKDDKIRQPVFMCEYAHAMGNGPGEIWDYWDAIYNNKKLIGGCIWEWADHVYLEDNIQKYGGDFKGELTNDGNFCCDGMVFSDRTFKPGTYEIKNTYAPFRIKWENSELKVRNMFDFTSFDGYSFEYEISVDGESKEKYIVRSNTGPHDEFTIKPVNSLPESCLLGCYITVKMISQYCELGELQALLPVPVVVRPITAERLSVNNGEYEISAESSEFSYVISKQTGNIISIKKKDKELLSAPVRMTFDRPTTDNDNNMKALWYNTNVWQGENFDCVFNKVYDVQTDNNSVKITGSYAGVSRLPFFKYTLIYHFYSDGSVSIKLGGEIRDRVIWLPRLGFEFKLPYDDSEFTYFGNGPLESYCDMKHHGVVGLHKSDADSEYVNYVRPQEHGNHTNCKMLDIKDSIVVTADTVMDICVLHNNREQIEAAQHIDELVKGDSTYVRVDYKVSGIGSNSCGPELQDKYRLKEKQIDFGFRISLNN